MSPSCLSMGLRHGRRGLGLCGLDRALWDGHREREPEPASLASASPRSSDTSVITTLAPFWASLRAVAEPKPPAPPVTIAEALAMSRRTPNGSISEAGTVARR
jgi:hypothetical protein